VIHTLSKDIKKRLLKERILKSGIKPYKAKGKFNIEFTKWYKEILFLGTNFIKESENSNEIKNSCYKGCAKCCNQAIDVYGFEVIPIITYLKKSDKENILKKAIKYSNIIEEKLLNKPIEQLNDLELFNYKNQYKEEKLPCIFLENGACSIYSVRPICCSIYYSYGDNNKCNLNYSESLDCLSYEEVEDYINFKILSFLKLNKNRLSPNYKYYDIMPLPIAIKDYLL
jgi:Fe-S-cluster containining protein